MTKVSGVLELGLWDLADLLIGKLDYLMIHLKHYNLQKILCLMINAASIKTSEKLAEIYGTFPKFDECEIDTPR